jgi:predicted nucleotidyltransferase
MGTLWIEIPAKEIEAFCRKWRVKEFSIFGSALRDDFGPTSDVDVLVKLQPDHGLSLCEWIDMMDALKGVFQREVDLAAKGGLRNPFRHQEILRTAEVVYAA